jgi:HlyD family secretion protein
MRRRILYIILGAIAIAAIVSVIVWRARPAGQSAQETRSASVERTTMLVAISASGSIEPQFRVNLVFEGSGRVAEVAVEVEETVKAGALLAQLDTAQLELQVQQAQAALASAEAQLAQLQAGPQPEEIAATEANLRAAEAQVSMAAADLDQVEGGASNAQIAAAEADLASAITQQRAAEEAHDMTMKCFTFEWMGEEHTICPALGPPEEQARYNLEAANHTLAAAQTYFDELAAGADTDQLRTAQASVGGATAQRDAAQAQLDRLLAGPTDEQIGAASARVEQAQVALELAELALEKSSLRAPFDGIVAAVNTTAGEMAPTGLPAIVLIDNSRFRVSVSVDEIDVSKLREGQSAEMTLDALPDIGGLEQSALTGTVERIAPAATIEGGVVYYEVIIGLDPTDAPLRADMTANGTIVVEELANVLTIPTWVVHVDRSTGQTYVDRQVGERTERVDVELGVRHGGVAQVLDGLSDGDVVIWVGDNGFTFGHQ